jgi:hypothetical protein
MPTEITEDNPTHKLQLPNPIPCLYYAIPVLGKCHHFGLSPHCPYGGGLNYNEH